MSIHSCILKVEPRRGAPSSLHEKRVETLTTLCLLAGFETGLSTLPGGGRPDVVRLRGRDGGVFVGDAKATETPGNTETFARLSIYVDFLTSWIGHGGTGTMALAVNPMDAYAWQRTLRCLLHAPSGGRAAHGCVDFVDTQTALVWHSFVTLHRASCPPAGT